MKPVSTQSFGVTQQDIARSLNLSRSTVAQALNPRLQWKLQPETVELVKKRAAEMNYYPQRFAKVLREGKTYTIGAVFRLARYYAPHEQIRLLSHIALERGYHLVTIDRNWFTGRPKAEEKFVLEAGLDGLLFYNIKFEEPPHWASVLAARSFPMLNIGSDFAQPMDALNWEIRESYAAMTRHHIAQGSRRLTLVLPTPASSCIPEVGVIYRRIEGFVDALREAGGSVTAPFPLPSAAQHASTSGLTGEIVCREAQDDFDGNAYAIGEAITEKLIRERRLSDSLICSNDDMAAGALTVCLKHSLRVSDDVKISGTDNAPYSAYCGIPLTTIAQPTEAIATAAIDRLIARIEGRIAPGSPETRTFPCEIVVRRSTSPSTANPTPPL